MGGSNTKNVLGAICFVHPPVSPVLGGRVSGNLRFSVQLASASGENPCPARKEPGDLGFGRGGTPSRALPKCRPAVQPPAPKASRRAWIAVVAATTLVAVGGGWAVSHFSQPPKYNQVIRFQITPPEGWGVSGGGNLGGGSAISQDGQNPLSSGWRRERTHCGFGRSTPQMPG